MKDVLLILVMTMTGLMSVTAQNNDNYSRVLHTDSNRDSSYLALDQINRPILFVIYGPGCGICIKELKAISQKIENWENLYNVKLIAFSRNYKKDYGRQMSSIKEKSGLFFPLYIDINGNLANYLYKAPDIDAISFSRINGLHLIVPQTIILSKDKKVVFQKQGYQTGDEEKIEAILKKI